MDYKIHYSYNGIPKITYRNENDYYDYREIHSLKDCLKELNNLNEELKRLNNLINELEDCTSLSIEDLIYTYDGEIKNEIR